MAKRWSLMVHPVDGWPPLAWLACCRPGSSDVTVYAGTRVEACEQWFGEVVWDGPYGRGRFDETDIVFGSGAVVGGAGVVFVPAAHTLDRLHVLALDGVVLVSNSLPALMRSTGGRLASEFDYRGAFQSVIGGLSRYTRSIPTTVGNVGIQYYDNLTWDGDRLHETPKPRVVRDFGSFESYAGFLDDTMRRMADNAASVEREHPYGLLSTLSSGYDSTTVAVLARRAGCREVVGFDEARGGGDDNGGDLAGILGLEYHGFSSNAWTLDPGSEIPFIAAGPAGGGSCPFAAARPVLGGRLLLTGYLGDATWEHPQLPLHGEFARADNSGADLTEFRLSAGFVQATVPSWGGLQRTDIGAIGGSSALDPWRIGGRYDRPICRRIIEEGGVPRGMFAKRKLALARMMVMTAPSIQMYGRWLDEFHPELADATYEETLTYQGAWAVDVRSAEYAGGPEFGRPVDT